MNKDTHLMFEAYINRASKPSEDCEGPWMNYGKPGKNSAEQEDGESEDDRYNREAGEMESARLKYYEDIFRKIKSGDIMVGDFIEWCEAERKGVKPLKGQDDEMMGSNGDDEEVPDPDGSPIGFD